MQKFQCVICGYVYDPDKRDEKSEIPAGTSFEDLPDDWVCPICGTRKTDFQEL